MKYCVLNERGKFCAKIFLLYTDIVIFVLGHFIVTPCIITSHRTAGNQIVSLRNA